MRMKCPRWLFGVLLAADLLKHAVLLGSGPIQPWPDSALYWKLGQEAATGDVWLVESRLAFRTPLYPWFLAACQRLGGEDALWIMALLQHAMELATTPLAAATVYAITRSRPAALAAYGGGLLLTARPMFANWVLTETGSTFLTTYLLFLLMRQLATPCRTSLIGSAITLGMGILLRPAAVAFLPALIWVAWRSATDHGSIAGSVKRTAAALAIAAAVVFPWCARNWLLWNRFTVTVFLGRELWAATFHHWPGAYLDIPETGAGGQLRTLLRGEPVNVHHNWSVASALSRKGLNDVEQDDLMRDVALEAMRKDPLRAGVHFVARCLTFWYVKDWELTDLPSQAPWDGQRGWSTPQRRNDLERWLRWTPERQFPCVWAWTAATWIGVFGLILNRRHRTAGMAVAAILGGLTLLTAALEIPCYRYRCIVEPTMVVAAVSGVAMLLPRSAGTG
jgi:hypothetical protein